MSVQDSKNEPQGIAKSFLYRLKASKGFNGQQPWLAMLNSIPRDHWPRYHRFTPQLEPLLSQDELLCCVDNMLASLFYIRLDSLPVFSGHSFTCKAKILCRLDPGRELHALLSRLRRSRACFCIQSAEHKQCNTQVSPFCMPIQFCVPSMVDLVHVEIEGLTRRPQNISNCPYRLSDLVMDQGLHLIFGRSDHQRRLLPLYTSTSS